MTGMAELLRLARELLEAMRELTAELRRLQPGTFHKSWKTHDTGGGQS